MSISKAELFDRIEDRVELKNVDLNLSMSEETWCFSATVYFDGEQAARAENRGRGGKTILSAYMDNRGNSRTRKDKREELREFVSELPEIETDYGPMEYDAEMLIDALVGRYDFMRTVKRHIRKDRLVFRTSDQGYGVFSYVDHMGNPEKALKSMKEKHDIEKVYNEGLSA